jgi:hypothetical protein
MIAMIASLAIAAAPLSDRFCGGFIPATGEREACAQNASSSHVDP